MGPRFRGDDRDMNYEFIQRTRYDCASKQEESAMSRHTLIAGLAALAVLAARPALAADAKQMEENKNTVRALYEAALNKKDFEEASKYLGSRYTQHNPGAADGPEGLKAFIAFLKDKFPNNRSEIKRIFADGDYVIVHVHAVREPGTRGNAIIDIFKLENGKVVEHWDVNPADPGEGRKRQRDVLTGRRRRPPARSYSDGAIVFKFTQGEPPWTSEHDQRRVSLRFLRSTRRSSASSSKTRASAWVSFQTAS